MSTTLTCDIASLSSLVAQAMQTSGNQQHRVDALRAAVNSGNYKIDTIEIATSILKELS